MPILTTSKVNQTLHTLVFRARWEEKGKSLLKGITPRMRLPVKPITTSHHPDNDTLQDIAKSVSSCLSVLQAVRSLIFEGVQLRLQDVKQLSKNLTDNETLAHIFFKGCFIGDKSAQVLCQVLKGLESLEWLDLTCCDLTSIGVSAVAAIIKNQCLKWRSFCWQNSVVRQSYELLIFIPEKV